jgi:hypothetical protein
VATIARTVRLTAAESFWYVLQCIAFGAGYFAKVPVRKALSEVGLAQMTGAEQFWYVLQCIAFGAGYFAKVPVKKALSEMTAAPAPSYQPAHGAGYRPEYEWPTQAPGYADQLDPRHQPQAADYGHQQRESLPPGRGQGLPPGRHQPRHQSPRQPGY